MAKIRYKEIKYVSHILRNFYLFFILFLSYFLIYGFQPKILDFLKGLFVFVISYSVVYFLNDYIDRDEDVTKGKSNLYLDIENKKIYWLLIIVLGVSGLLFAYSTSLTALVLLLLLYFLNYLYSFKPFRFRNIHFVKEINIFLIYFVKLFLMSEYLGFQLEINNIPFSIFIMASSCAALSLSLYKRHLKTHKITEYFFGSIFAISLVASCFFYSKIIVLFLPLLPVVVYLSLKYKNEQIPIGKYQAIYSLYTLIVYIVALSLTMR